MQRNEVRNAMISVSTPFAAISCITEDGEILFKRGYPAGMHSIAPLVPHMGETDILEFEQGIDVFTKAPRATRIPYGEGANDSGANPDFVVTSASRNARETERTLRNLQRKTASLDRRLAAFNALSAAYEKAAEKEIPEPTDDVQLIDPLDNQTPTEEEAPGKEKTDA